MIKILRGLLIDPISPKQCDLFKDGALVLEHNKIIDFGDFVKIFKKYKNAEIEKIKGVIMPAFTDLHLHWVQNKVKGCFRGSLMPWLKNHIWPEEAKFKNKKYAKKCLEDFFDELLACGTKNAVIYSSIHKEATEMAIEMGLSKGNFVIGNVLMDQNSPPYLQMETDEEIKIVKYFAKKYREKYAITPRFAPTCTFELMKEVAKIAREYGCYVQTHLSENKGEIAFVKKLFPQFKNYTDVYDKAGLLFERTILGHCIHLSDSELEVLAKRKVKIAHCPTSNIALKSGRMPVEKIIKYGIEFALGSDIGAGPKLEMTDVIETYLKVQKGKVDFPDAFYRATIGGAKIINAPKEFIIIKNINL